VLRPTIAAPIKKAKPGLIICTVKTVFENEATCFPATTGLSDVRRGLVIDLRREVVPTGDDSCLGSDCYTRRNFFTAAGKAYYNRTNT
jgi:hypothetical protein